MLTNILLIIFAFLYVCECSLNEDQFNEELLLKPLYSDQLYAYFQFSTIWNTESKTETCK